MKAAGGNARTCHTPVARFKKSRDGVWPEFPRPNIQERPHNSTNHVLEKSTAAYPEDPFFGIAPPHRFKHGPDTVFHLGRGGAEGREVMGPFKVAAGRVHGSCVHRIREAVDIPAVKRTDDVLPPHTILIGLGDGGTARMKLQVRFFNFPHANLRRQERIDAPQNSIGIHRTARLDIGYLPLCMNTGVRPPGTRHINGMIEEFFEGSLQGPLHRREIGLDLPSVELGAIVCKGQLEVPHRFGYSIPVSTAISITATIITCNEEAHIAAAIASLACCDEVVVVDSGSTDRTREIAERCGARVLVRDWDGYSNQKNYAASAARHNWILSVDADEQLSVELANEITQWKRAGKGAAGSMPRRAFYFGAWIRHSGWYPDRKTRLYDRRWATWQGDFVHETLRVEGPIVSFTGDLLHFPYRDWPDHRRRIDRYTRLAAESAQTSGKKGNVARLLLGPPLSFLQTFFFRAGFLDGWRGAVIAAAGARYVFLRELRILRWR